MWLIKERLETEKNGDRKADKNIEIVWLIFHFPPRFQDRQNHSEASSNFIQLTTVSDYKQPLSWFLILTKAKYFYHTIKPLFSKLYRSRWLNNSLFSIRLNFFRPWPWSIKNAKKKRKRKRKEKRTRVNPIILTSRLVNNTNIILQSFLLKKSPLTVVTHTVTTSWGIWIRILELINQQVIVWKGFSQTSLYYRQGLKEANYSELWIP